MNIFLFILLFILFSCGYPDIDTIPKFNLKKTIQEKCFLGQIAIQDIEECKIIIISNRL
jgi:hypothetical protein